jgi:hypothetical protein
MKNVGAAFYARQGSSRADFWTLLHPPYTAWNISYVVVGSTLAPTVNWLVLTIILASFFCGTGIAAHALDELNGHPLKTGFSDKSLKLMSTVSLFVAFILSTLASLLTTPWLLVFYGAGAFLVLAYNLEWWHGLIHTDLGFALSWGAFPVIVGYWSQTGHFSLAALVAASAATLLSLAQRSLSTQARFVRRKTSSGSALFHTADNHDIKWDRQKILSTWEKPLRLLSWSVILLAISLLVTK